MVSSILVTLDGSELAESVLPYVTAIAQAFDSEVTLFQVINQPIIGVFGEDPTEWAALKDVEESTEKAANEYLNAKAEELNSIGINARYMVTHGSPADRVLEYVDAEEPDLVAMSTRGRSGLRRMMLGSVTTRVLQGCRSPLLIVGPKDSEAAPVAHLEDIIVPLDASHLAEGVLPAAREIASGLQLDITLVTVIPSAGRLYVGADMRTFPTDVISSAREAARLYIEDVAQRIREEDGLAVTCEVLQGDPGDAIVEYAAKTPSNLVAMSTHGRSGVGRWLMGSVADKVVRASGDPVIIVRSPQTDE